MKKIVIAVLLCVMTTGLFTACVGGFSPDLTDDQNKVDSGIVDVVGDNNLSVDKEDKEEVSFPQNAGENDIFTFKYLGYVYYGTYPQTIAHKKAVKEMSETTDNTGYYYSTYDDSHYEKITSANVYGKKYEFSDETVITEENTYYFKVEPIKWKVFGQFNLNTGRIQLYLLSELILDSMCFKEIYTESFVDGNWYGNENQLANNWAYSDVRKWLNDDFYKMAFTEEERASIVERETKEVCPIYNEEDPTEKVYCISYDQAVTLGEYTLAKVSDYARCRDTFMAINPEVYGNGRYWLTNAGTESYQVAYVSNYNNIVNGSGESAGSEFMGVRPAMIIDVDAMFEILQEEEEEEK